MGYIDSFENKKRDRLYADINKVLNPSISKNNISKYKIILNENIYPLRVYYPKKISNIKDIIIYIHGISNVSGLIGSYNNICKNLALNTDKLILAIDYDESSYYIDNLNKCLNTIKYLIDELILEGFLYNNISLMGDSIGGTLALSIFNLLNINTIKLIIINPILKGNYFNNNANSNNIYNKLNNYYKNNLKYKKDYQSELVFPLYNKNINKNNILIISSTNNPLKEESILYKKISECNLVEIPIVKNNNIYNFLNNLFYKTIFGYLNETESNC